ncbi:MAG TPA: HEAT repeat domain-containing protein, partial [Planctomycetaceae bacterium]|nr:HEAT repeat domain-containing protein [Planctomycetaceae bacterium]
MDVIDRRPVDAPFAGRILTRRTDLIGALCLAVPIVLFFAGFFGAIEAYHFGFEVKPPAGGQPALSPAVAGVLAGTGMALAAVSFYFVLRYVSLPLDRYLRRVARREISPRPNRLGDPRDPEAAFVEIVPRESWNRGLQQTPADIGFLWIDSARREVLFEGDRERIRIPAGCMLTCRGFKVPIRVHPFVFQKFFFVVSCVHPAELIELSFAHRDGLGVLGAKQRQRRAVASCERIRSLIASQAPVPAVETERRLRLHADADAAKAPRDANRLADVATQELMDRCDAYWEWLGQPNSEKPSGADAKSRYGEYVAAINEMASRGPDVVDWAAARLAHAEFDAREQAAFLLGEVANRHPLGPRLDAVVAALSEMTRRPVSDDSKEAQANTAAVIALGKIGDRRGVGALRHVLTSDEWADDDIQWDAVEALGQIVGERF